MELESNPDDTGRQKPTAHILRRSPLRTLCAEGHCAHPAQKPTAHILRRSLLRTSCAEAYCAHPAQKPIAHILRRSLLRTSCAEAYCAHPAQKPIAHILRRSLLRTSCAEAYAHILRRSPLRTSCAEAQYAGIAHAANMWQLVQQGAGRYYGPLEEFVTSVLDNVPELLTCTERVQLVLGLRARVVLECCHIEDFSSPQAI
ncbi:unnamed protein product [Pleuronectes platessa]|uniref:TERF1-interacting nuclear factor 2 N-terminal domain-containing protein n=1 Tax=Pleuronectes platessa TaxID=8262 RepID=A0A9N7YEQ9_PLEPL|nr:unnamed protein product [Pleuronectes platessa]